MITKEKIFTVLSGVKKLIHSDDFKEKHCLNEKAFSRNRKLSFIDVILFILGMPRKSLPTELDIFFEKSNISITKQAFSKARYQISEEAFFSIYQCSTDIFQIANETALWEGYRLFAIDGSMFTVPHNPKTETEFGIFRNNHSEYPMGRASVLYDITNDLIVDAKFTGITTGEREHASTLLESIHLKQSKKYKNLILFDRGYPSRNLIHDLETRGFSYLIRCSHSFLKCVNECPEGDHVVYDEYNGVTTKLRVIKTEIDNDNKQILVSNLFGSKQGIEYHKHLYRMRWGIETKYGELKTRLRIENFSGKNPQAVYQEFYAALFISNIVAMIKAMSEIELGEELSTSKHQYQLNRSYILGLVARKIRWLLTTSPLSELLTELVEKVKSVKSIIRTGRHCRRTQNHHGATNGFYIRVTI